MRIIATLICITAMVVLCGCNPEDLLYRTGVSMYSSAMKELKTALKNEPLRYIDTNGSAASLRLLQDGLLDFAVVRNDVLNKALEDHQKQGERITYAAVANVADETCYIITREDSDIKTLFDLRGKKVAIGRKDHGTINVAGNILNAHGFKKSLLTPYFVSFKESIQLLQSGEIDALFSIDVFPSKSIKALSEKIPVRLISLDEHAANHLLNYHRGYFIRTIPAGTFVGQDSEIMALKVNSVLMVNQDVPDAVIEKIILALTNYHHNKNNPGENNSQPQETLHDELLMLSKKEYDLTYHPAAAKLYEEHGIEVKTFEKVTGFKTVVIGQD